MIRTLAITAGLALSAMLATPALAQKIDSIEYERVRDRDDVVLDPAKSYLLVESSGMDVSNFILLPTQEQRDDWERQRQEALAEAIEDYPRDMSRYTRQERTWRESNGRIGREPVLPIEPTNENFGWPDIESRRVISFGPQNRFAKPEGASLWLHEVPAGEYIFYGLGMPGFTECACMGSVSFTIEPGSVTAVKVGRILLDTQGNEISEFPDGTSSTDVATRIGIYIDPPSDLAYDPRIERSRIVAAQFAPVPSLSNWGGGMVSRVQPIDNVIAYDRDQVIDMRPAAVAARQEAARAAEAEMQAVDDAAQAYQDVVDAAAEAVDQAAERVEEEAPAPM